MAKTVIKLLEEKIDLILTNHLPHLSERIIKLETKLDIICKGIYILAVAVIGNILTTIFKN